MVPQSSTVLGVLVFGGTSNEDFGCASWGFLPFFWPFEVWLILDFFQDLMYWFSEHYVNHLRSRRPKLPSKIPLGSIIIVVVRPKTPPLLTDNLTLPLALLLVLLEPLILIYLIHKLAYAGNRFPNQRPPQAILDR